MEKYDYYEAVKNDVKEYIQDEAQITPADVDYDRNTYVGEIYDQTFASDSVTGNGSGSYTFSAYQAEENIAHNLDLLNEALQEFGETDINVMEKGAEWADVTCRCYVLAHAIEEAVDELEQEEKLSFDEPEKEDEEETI